mmetsp:Transcript_29526/g.41542  ORF Transcript_29526/g.41542 Transcript_29526/m.41542 type:complete len:901 (+) Transcript_29526:99-2801(+)
MNKAILPIMDDKATKQTQDTSQESNNQDDSTESDLKIDTIKFKSQTIGMNVGAIVAQKNSQVKSTRHATISTQTSKDNPPPPSMARSSSEAHIIKSNVNANDEPQSLSTSELTVQEEEYSVCSVGAQCGKSALIVKYVYGRFSNQYEDTVEDNHKKQFFYEGRKVTLKILDTAGSDDYSAMRSQWFSKSQGFVFVYSITSEHSFQMIPSLFEEVVRAKMTDKFPMVLVGTQADQSSKRKVSRKQGKDLARKYNAPFFETSAVTGDNVDNAFEALVLELRYGKKKDPFIQDNPYYKNSWNDLIQVDPKKFPFVQALPPQLQVPLVEHAAGWYLEYSTSSAVNNYIFPLNVTNTAITETDTAVATRMFGITLEEAFVKQKDVLPSLAVPRVLPLLIHAFYFLDGCKTEGVFRVPAFPNELKQAREMLDKGNFSILSVVVNVHTVAALLKLWFRELKDPLVPQSLYDRAVKNPSVVSEVVQIFSECPQLNQAVIECLLGFLLEISHPDIVKHTKMDIDNLAMVFAPSILRCPFDDPQQVLAFSEAEKMFVLSLTSVIEKRLKDKPVRHIAPIPHTILFEREEKYIPYYKDYFSVEKDRIDFLGKDKAGPVIVSVANAYARDEFRAYFINKDGEQRFLMPACKEKEVPNNVIKSAPQLGILKLYEGKNQKKLCKEILQFESMQGANTYKWGVLYLKDSQDEDQMYANVSGSAEYEEFLRFLGDKVVLKGWSQFRGGLDVKKDSTGTHSIYTQFQDSEIMFHVGTLLPYLPNDKQQLERKRHHGNDIIVIIFKEGNQPFQPLIMKSEFNHIFVVISQLPLNTPGVPQNKIYYRLAITTKDGVPPYGPPLHYPGIFEKGPAFRDFLFTKLINGERAALHGCPSFRNKMVTVRKTQLENIEKSFGKK